jgi:hypothetical protein
MGKIIDLTGCKFGRLEVVKFAGLDKKHIALWVCQCDCGNQKVVRSDRLKSGKTRSCGCLQKELLSLSKLNNEYNLTHGLSKTKLYRVWVGIKDRCFDEKRATYKNYGGRGITVCDEWRNDFKAFYDWAIANGYKEGLTIDRINNDGNYEPNNCRWATRIEQNNNTRRNRYITFNEETLTLTEWAKRLGVSYQRIQSILSRGYGLEKILQGD